MQVVTQAKPGQGYEEDDVLFGQVAFSVAQILEQSSGSSGVQVSKR